MTTSPTDKPSQTPETMRLTKTVKRFVDFFWYFSIIAMIAYSVMTLIVGLSIPADPAERHTDINFHLGFTVYPEAIESLKAKMESPSELIQGQGEIKVNNTQGVGAWYLASSILIAMGLFFLWGLSYLRKLFANLVNREAFNAENHGYIRKLGALVIIWNIAYPILIYIGGQMILADIGPQAENLLLTPAISVDVAGFVMGLALLILAEILREAALIHEEQALTI